MSKVAVITGGSRGLGKAMSLRLAKLGYNIVVNFVSDSSKAKTEELIKEAKEKYGVDGLAVQADVADYKACEKLFDAVIDKFGTVDVLVNNAGITHNLPFTELTPEKYNQLININLISHINCAHLAIPHMLKAGKGCIVNTSSIGGLMGVAEQVDYCAAKSGVIGFTRALAVEYGKSNIRVNSIAPGMIMTDMLAGVDQEAVQALKEGIPLGEIGEPEDIAECLEYIVKADYLTGQTISPNGGILMP